MLEFLSDNIILIIFSAGLITGVAFILKNYNKNTKQNLENTDDTDLTSTLSAIDNTVVKTTTEVMVTKTLYDKITEDKANENKEQITTSVQSIFTQYHGEEITPQQQQMLGTLSNMLGPMLTKANVMGQQAINVMRTMQESDVITEQQDDADNYILDMTEGVDADDDLSLLRGEE